MSGATRERLALLLLGAVLLGTWGTYGVVSIAAAQAGESGGNTTTNQYGETVISGLYDDEMSLLEKGVEDGKVYLIIRSEGPKTVEVADALASGGDEIAAIRFESRSLSEGRNRIEVDAESVQGAYIVNLVGNGPTAQIPVGGSLERAETKDTYAAATFGAFILGVTLLLAWVKRELEGKGAERKK